MFTTTKNALVNHLQDDLKIKKTDLVFLHSGVLGLGKIEGGIETITAAFENVLAEGLLIIPSFSYSWCNNEVFDPLSTACPKMGTYASEAWKNEKFIRSPNPNFSVSALINSSNQKLIEYIFSSPAEKSCFGEGSVFDRMYKTSEERRGHILLLGGAHNDVVFRSTFLHYVEEIMKIPYRYIKRFLDPQNKSRYVDQLVRYITEEELNSIHNESGKKYDLPVVPKYEIMGKELIESKLITIKTYGYSKSRMVHINKFCNWLKKKLSIDPDYLLN